MISQISSTIAEIFLQLLEDIHIKQLLDTKYIIFYTSYVDDILIIYDTNRTKPDFFNTYVHTYIKFNPTYVNNGRISFLDLLIIRKPSNLEIDILRKQTTTDKNHQFPFKQPHRTQGCCIQ